MPLSVEAREQAGREASPRRQSAKVVHKGVAIDPQGFDAGNKVAGRKRDVVVVTLGLPLSAVVHLGDIQHRDGVRDFLRTARRSCPFIEGIFADAGRWSAICSR